MNLNFSNRILIINDEEEWKTSIHVHAKNNIWVCCKVRTLKQLTISSHSLQGVLIELELNLSIDCDFLFVSFYSGAHAYLVNADT